MKHGWYFKKQSEFAGTNFYSTPDGGEVEVTDVSTEPPNWDDVVDRGPVVDWLRQGLPNTSGV